MKGLILLLNVLLVLATCQADQLTVSAASSLTDVMKEIATAYQKQSGTEIRLSFGASSMLERQIEEGAPVDVFLSADEPKMDALAKAGLLALDTRADLLSNTLVIIVPADSDLALHSASDLVDSGQVQKIAISDPEIVPVGIYSKQYLTNLGLWDKIRGKVVPTENVRASLAAVESGNVQAGFVYKTDMLISKKVKAALEVPAGEGPKISYPVAALKSSHALEPAKKFIEYLKGPQGIAVFQKYGFSVVQSFAH